MKNIIVKLRGILPSSRRQLPFAVDRRSSNFVKLLAVAAGVVLAQSTLAQVALPFVDHFAYTDGTSLGSPGNGDATWTLGNSLGSGGLTNRSVAALSYPGLATASGLGVVIPQFGSSSRTKGVQFNSGTFGAGNPTMYASFLMSVQTAPTSIRLLCYFRASTGGGTPVVGVFLTSSNTLLLSKSSTTPLTTPVTLSAGTHLVVIRYKWTSATSGDDQAALWVDPGSLGVAEGSVPGPNLSTTSGSDQASLVNLSFQQTSSDSGVVWLDEVRLGLLWADVAPSGCTPPTQFSVTGGGAYCSGGSGVSVGLANSEAGIDYQLKLNGSPVGSPVAGTAAALDFGLQTVAGTYTVAGSNTTTACVGPMSGNAIVTINTAPAISASPTNLTVCVGATATFNVTATGAGLSYQWQVDTGGGFGDVTTGTGGTSASYTTAVLAIGDSGSQYHCIVSGTCSPPATAGPATVTVSSGVSINSSPSDKTVSVGSTATFTVAATGPGLTYQWQFSVDNGSTYNNVTTGTGGTSASYTTAALALADTGTKYKCVVGASCGSPGESNPATVTVNEAVYRSLASGAWNLAGAWEQSYDGGGNWVPGTTSPNAGNTTNILVRSGHTVTVTNAQTVDDLVVQAGGEVDASGATLTISDGTATVDCDVSGIIQVGSAAGSGFTVNSGAGLKFESGGKFIWNGATTVAIPTATWTDGSTCEVQNGTTTIPTGLGQSFYDFYWNKTSSGAVNLGGTLTTIRNNLRMRGSSDSANSVRFLGAAGTNDLRVGGNVVIEGGFTTLSGGSAANTVLNLIVGGNFTINSGATFDSRTSGAGSSANVLFTNTANAQAFANSGSIGHSGSGGGCPINWKISSGVTLNLATGNIALGTANNSTRDSVVVDGTLNFNTSLLTGPGALTNSTGVLVGNGTNALTSGLNSIAYGGTLNLPGLPTLTSGDSFKIFDATNSYTGAFAAIVPATPGTGLIWDTSGLTTSGTLKVASPVASRPRIVSIAVFGSDVVFSGTNGPANTNYYVFSSTNVALAVSSWTSNGSGLFDGSGNFTYTNAIDPAAPQKFYIIQLP